MGVRPKRTPHTFVAMGTPPPRPLPYSASDADGGRAPSAYDDAGCGWFVTGCLLPRAVGCLIAVLIILGILGYLAVTGELSSP